MGQSALQDFPAGTATQGAAARIAYGGSQRWLQRGMHLRVGCARVGFHLRGEDTLGAQVDSTTTNHHGRAYRPQASSHQRNGGHGGAGPTKPPLCFNTAVAALGASYVATFVEQPSSKTATVTQRRQKTLLGSLAPGTFSSRSTEEVGVDRRRRATTATFPPFTRTQRAPMKSGLRRFMMIPAERLTLMASGRSVAPVYGEALPLRTTTCRHPPCPLGALNATTDAPQKPKWGSVA